MCLEWSVGLIEMFLEVVMSIEASCIPIQRNAFSEIPMSGSSSSFMYWRGYVSEEGP